MLITGKGSPSTFFTTDTRVDYEWILTPCWVSTFVIISAASGSSRGRTYVPMCTTETYEPNVEKLCASSHAIGPAPMKTIRGGKSYKFQIFSDVNTGTVSIPGTTGIIGRPPVATAHLLNSRVLPSTSKVFGPVKAAEPRYTSTP